MKLKFNIVGLTHNDIQENLMDYARSAKGKRLKLVADPQNAYDPMAMKAYDANLFVGYVAAQDLEDVKALLAASGKKVLSAVCTGCKAKEDGHSGIYLSAVAHATVEGEREILRQAKAKDNDAKASGNEAKGSSDNDTKGASDNDAKGAKDKDGQVVMPKWDELEFIGGKILNLDVHGERLPMPEALSKAYGCVYDDSIYDAWHYSGPVFPIERLDRIGDCTDMLEDALEELLSIDQELVLVDREWRKRIASEEGVEESAVVIPDAVENGFEDLVYRRAELEAEEYSSEQEVKGYLVDFFENHRFDFSREMIQTRKHIQTLLSLVSDMGFRSDRERLLCEMGYLTCSDYREEAAHVFFIDTPIMLLRQQTGIYDYTDRLDEVERELEAFPFDLYSKFKADPADFLRQVFYKRVPRQEMKKLLSGIIFMVMNHRVDDVKRWGKNDDRLALQEMKKLRHIKPRQVVMSEEEKQEKARECIRKMAVEPGKSGFGWMVKAQSDWYVVQRVLVDMELIDIRDHAQFSEYLARVMGEESFASQGGKASDGRASDGRASTDSKRASGVIARPRIPLCKKKDLDQASVEVFEKTSPKEWSHLSDDELGGVQQAKFNHYCDIVETMLRLLGA